jgi:hypothetical protein
VSRPGSPIFGWPKVKLTTYDRQRIADEVRKMIAAKLPPIDGRYPLITKNPCVDGQTVKDARTKAQRAAKKKIWKRRQFVGWVDPAIVDEFPDKAVPAEPLEQVAV